jgi:hypothetical protein
VLNVLANPSSSVVPLQVDADSPPCYQFFRLSKAANDEYAIALDERLYDANSRRTTPATRAGTKLVRHPDDRQSAVRVDAINRPSAVASVSKLDSRQSNSFF